MNNTEELLYQAAKAMADAQLRIEELQAKIVELRAELQRQNSCCKCN